MHDALAIQLAGVVWREAPMAPTSSTALLHALLAAAGYQVRFRTRGSVECLVIREAEAWTGQGEGEDAALEDAVARMLPSHAARLLLARAIEAEASRGEQPSAVREPAVPIPPPALETTNVVPVEQGERHDGRSNDGNGNAARLSITEALDALDAILGGIEEQLAPLARLAPQRQRAFMLVWICRARSIDEAVPHEREVQRRVAAIARRLTELAKMFWPGSVRALQISARPWDVAELRVRDAPAPYTWADAAEQADHMLEAQLAEAEELGLDAEGWMEDASGAEVDADPDAVLARAAAAIDVVLMAMPDGGERWSPTAAQVEALVESARKLRAVRGRVADDVAWGSAMGRLRRVLPALGTRGARVREAIDPWVRPVWAMKRVRA